MKILGLNRVGGSSQRFHCGTGRVNCYWGFAASSQRSGAGGQKNGFHLPPVNRVGAGDRIIASNFPSRRVLSVIVVCCRSSFLFIDLFYSNSKSLKGLELLQTLRILVFSAHIIYRQKANIPEIMISYIWVSSPPASRISGPYVRTAALPL